MFDWDEANLAHIARHDVTQEEAEQAIGIAAVDLMRQYYEGEDRFVQMGATATGRVLVVVTTYRGDLVRVVSAYRAPASVRRWYWEERRQVHGD
jgi:uncharacterized DUF497 family protein